MKTGKKRILSITALCLACLLILGAAGYGAASFIQNHPISIVANGSGLSAPSGDRVLDAAGGGVSTLGSSFTLGSSSKELSATQIYTLACQETVGITTDVSTTNVFGQQVPGTVSGTGIIITSDGYILTNNHVIAEAVSGGYEVKVVLYNGDKYTAKIVGYEDDNDIAVLKIDATGLDAVTIADSDKLQVGQQIYAVGNPLGELTYTMTSGIVSALDRDITGDDGQTINMFQIDAAVNSGNSGGPVYNSYGEVIGVVTAKYSDTGVEGLGFAIPINDAAGIANELIKNGYVTGKPYMGISVRTISDQVAEYYNMVVGAYVGSVESGSCAEKAGLKVGDIITKMDDKEIKTSSDLIAAKKSHKAGDTVTLTVSRPSGEGKYSTVTLKLTFDEEKPGSSSSNSSSSSSNGSNGGGRGGSNGGSSGGWPFGNWPFGGWSSGS